jgi:hypothetical protein
LSYSVICRGETARCEMEAPKFARKAWDIPCLLVLFILIKKSRQNTKNVETSWQVG